MLIRKPFPPGKEAAMDFLKAPAKRRFATGIRMKAGGRTRVRCATAISTIGLVLASAGASALTTFTLPATAPGGTLYYLDVQGSFPGAAWSTLDRLYIPAGTYEKVYLGNLPQRLGGRPLVISNSGGQVHVTGAADSNYLFVVSGGANWLLTGQYDPVAQTGNVNFQGHAQHQYASSGGHYGIWIDDASGQPDAASPPVGLSVGEGASAFGLRFIEINGTPTSGVRLLPATDGAMDAVRISDLYIHDVEGAGLLLGSGGAQPQGRIHGMRVHDNRIARTGAQGIKISQVGNASRIENNVLYLTSLSWYSYFTAYADDGIAAQPREGSTRFAANIVVGAADAMFVDLPLIVGGDSHSASDVVAFDDNVFSNGRYYGGYLSSSLPASVRYRFARNRFHAIVYQYDSYGGAFTDPERILSLPTGVSNPISVTDNLWDGPQTLINLVADPNQAQGSITASGNAHATLTDPMFVASGMPVGFDPFNLSTWAATSNSQHGDNPVTYNIGDLVAYRTKLYRCIQSNTNARPDLNPASWTPVAQPTDDLRLAAGSPYANAGLVDDRLFEHDFETSF
jgi:hypothetical protein